MPKNIKIEGYDVLKKIGSGSFGVVYKCKKKDSDKIYAIKVEDKKKKYM